MSIKLKNLAKSRLSVSLSAADTTAIVVATEGERFPELTTGDYFYAALQNALGVIEFVKVTARAGDAMTIERAQGGTTAVSWNAGDIFAQRFTAETLYEYIHDQLRIGIALSSVAGTNTITATAPNFEAYSAQDRFILIPVGANTGAATINISSVGAKAIEWNGAALVGGELQAGQAYLIAYNGTNFDLLGYSPTLPTITAYAETLLESTDAAAARTVLELDDAAYTDVEQTFTAQQTPMSGTLTDAATVDWDGDTDGQVVTLTLGGNRTLAAPTNINQYALYVLRVAQDATGGRTLAWNSAYKFPSAVAPTLTATASAVDVFSFVGGAANTLEYIGQDVR